jgi:hypothetical protein
MMMIMMITMRKKKEHTHLLMLMKVYKIAIFNKIFFLFPLILYREEYENKENEMKMGKKKDL